MAQQRKGSRYQDVLAFSTAEGGRPLFNGTRPRRISKAIGVIEHIVREKERLDLLALHYFNDPRKWWRIVDANPDIVFGNDLLLEKGAIILIPRASEPGGGR